MNKLSDLFPNFIFQVVLERGPKKQYIPNWYQSLAQSIEKRVEEIEGESSNGRGRGPRYGPNSNYITKPLKLDFSRFNRKEDPTSWVCRAEQFFRFHSTPAEEQVSIASFHLEDDAQLWFQVLKQETPDATWEEFKAGIYATYGPHQFLDYFGELTKLKQQGTVQSYQFQFNKLLAKVGYLPQDRQVSCFVSGLSDSIHTEVQANCPTNLSTAISLARLYEAKTQSQRKFAPGKSSFQTVKQPSSSTGSPIKRLNFKELNERKKLGLCFRCNEQYAPGYKCKKLFAIQAIMESSDDDEEMEIENQEPEVALISIHAVTGLSSPRTMQVRGQILQKMVTVLVDSGSTHNFVNSEFAKRVGLPIETNEKFKVKVASGESLTSGGQCKQVSLHVQGVHLITDFYLLALEGYDVVLGAQWLQTLGPIIWDFSQLSMKFKLNGKEQVLHGFTTPTNKMVADPQSKLLSKNNRFGFLLHVVACQEKQKVILPKICHILNNYEKVIKEPTSLPSSRNHDHKIPLLQGQGPVSIISFYVMMVNSSEVLSMHESSSSCILGIEYLECIPCRFRFLAECSVVNIARRYRDGRPPLSDKSVLAAIYRFLGGDP
ncbi:uncharacterized protein Tco_1227727 [Tanacetum coccineum]